MNVHSNFIHASQKVETIPMSFKGCKVEQTLVHLQNGIILSKKRNKLLIYATAWRILRAGCLVKKANLKWLPTVSQLKAPLKWQDYKVGE